MALELWRATGNEESFFHSLSLAKETITTSYEGLSEYDKEMGIQKELATQICKMVFQNDIAKLTLEIAEPRMLKVEKDKSVTFAGMLGTIGKYPWINIELRKSTEIIFSSIVIKCEFHLPSATADKASVRTPIAECKV